MDIQALAQQFSDEHGNFRLDPTWTLPMLGEFVYAQESHDKQRTTVRFFDHSQGEAEITYTREQVRTRILAVAARLQQVGTPGQHVAICAPNSPEYLFGFLGAMYAAMVPVPLYDPQEPGHKDQLASVLEVAQPAVVLTNRAAAGAVRRHFASRPVDKRPRILAIDALPDTVAASFDPAHPAVTQWAADTGTALLDAPAMLQFTSGSTRTPAGVELTHKNLLTNIMQIVLTAKLYEPLRFVSWLPLHHDMGLILAALSLLMGHEMDLLTPRDFLFDPQRWAQRLDAKHSDAMVATCIPNFALELVSRPGVVDFSGIDLSRVGAFVVGSEPVNPTAVRNFIDAAIPYGFPAASMWPTYGLAEAALLAAVPQQGALPTSMYFERAELSMGKAVIGAAGTTEIMACGRTIFGQSLAIVDAANGQELADGEIGEIWIAGGNVARGYYQNSQQTAATFSNRIRAREQDSRAAGREDAQWLATGDLGVIIDGDLYITGRIKDLIIVAGRNHYPQDIELTVQEASEDIRPAAVAAFAIDGVEGEQLIILAERDVNADPANDAAMMPVIREAVASAHGIVPADIRILDPGTIARTSSGKIARANNRLQYLASREQ
ncbi:MAG: AMP-binding protein [Corynebacterium sp.]|nr:AMP-binding protein [Corynebacterium sp.]